MEKENSKIKNGKSLEPLNDSKSLEKEYLLELNKEEDNLCRKIEQEKKEYEEFIRKVRKYSDNLDDKIEYIKKNTDKEKYIIKAFEEIITEEERKNKRISINLINDYLNLFKENKVKLKKIEQLKSDKYQYQELFLLKIAEIEIENIENGIISQEYLNEKIKYILSILGQAELISEKNETKLYLVEIYRLLSKLYEIDTKIKDKNKSIKYLNKYKKLKKEIKKNKNKPTQNVIKNLEKENNSSVNEIKNEKLKKYSKDKWVKASIFVVIVLLVLNVGIYTVNARNLEIPIINNNDNDSISDMDDSLNHIESENPPKERVLNKKNDKKVPKNPEKNSSKTISSRPTVKKSLPTRYSEYGDYDPDTQEYFMEIEDFLTQYYIDYEKAVSNSDYSYVSRDLVDDGQLSKELKISIPRYKNKSVYVKHFSIYNFDLYDNEASFNLDTVYVIDNERIQIETQRMTVYYDYYNQCWLIDNYTDWDIIYKQDYNPDEDYFDFTNYRDYF
ncbi:hypothetical protein [Peptacetobacter sp.]|uniref:hypothetical protein n=1 Tax=Peptacetobacter sp. TaxID=2991975 RepID=UPI002636CAD5|nr:hypothetical protein [Peptacetobacter sp.]